MIRPARRDDAAGIRAVHLAAFPTSVEADLVERLEAEGDAVVSLVAEEEGQVTGHVLLSRMAVCGDGRAYRALGLAPVAVAPSVQRSGIGSDLIREALRTAGELGEDLVFVLGEPAYYCRFGFDAAAARPFASPYAGEYLMALRLGGAALPRSGQAEYAPAFAGLE